MHLHAAENSPRSLIEKHAGGDAPAAGDSAQRDNKKTTLEIVSGS
jgi:hypothetical protein